MTPCEQSQPAGTVGPGRGRRVPGLELGLQPECRGTIAQHPGVAGEEQFCRVIAPGDGKTQVGANAGRFARGEHEPLDRHAVPSRHRPSRPGADTALHAVVFDVGLVA